MSAKQLGCFLFLLVLFASLMVPLLPALNPLPNRDAGVYLYAGQRILDGDTLYRDIWDHKPPLIHWINACGLWLGNGHVSGVLILEALSFAIAAALLYRLLATYLDSRLAAGFGVVVFISAASPFLENGDLTEEYALPFQCLGAWCLLRRGGLPAIWQCVLCGAATAFCFLLRPNMIGIGVVGGLFLLSYLKEREWQAVFGRCVALGAGSVLVLAVALTPFAVQKVIPDLIDQVFRFNTAYSASSPLSKLHAVAAGMKHYLILNGAIFTAVGTVFILFRQRMRSAPLVGRPTRLAFFALAWLAIEVPFSSLSGRPYLHYFTTWLTPLSLCGGFIAWHILAGYNNRDHTSMAPSGRRSWAVIVVAIAMALPQFSVGVISVVRWHNNQRKYFPAEVVSYVLRNSTSHEAVLLWGAEPVINFITKRPAGTRYAYQYPLLTTGYANEARIAEFVHSISQSRPVIIIDTSSSNSIIPPIDGKRRANWSPESGYSVPASLESFYTFVLENYQKDTSFEPSAWEAYRLKSR
ncbi:MAG TPA: glycosyltransferase family 39 protein [Chthoniobacter sp.]|nr:glycosyltransferase family 39 protein [Chthoniobacter sp.]